MSMMADTPRETLSAGLLLGGTHDRFKLFDALGKAGQLGRDARDLGLQLGQALCSLTRCLLAGSGVTNVGAAPRAPFDQPLFLELRVGVLHGHQGYTELLGVGPSAREAIPRAERPCGDFVSEPGCDLAGVELPLRL